MHPTSHVGIAAPFTNWALRSVFGLLILGAVVTPFLHSKEASAALAVCVVVGLGTSGSLFIIRSRALASEERRAWRLFGIGLTIAAAGVAVHAATWLIASDVPVFGPIDLILLTGYLVGITGLARLPHAAGSGWQRLRLLLDGIIGAVAVGALLWTLSLRGLAMSLSTAGIWERFVGSTYVLLDVLVLVVLMIVVVRRSTYRFDIRLVFISGAAIAQGIGDVAFLTSGTGRSFTQAEPIYPLSILAVALFLAAAVSIDREPKRREYVDRSSTPAWAIILPYSFVVGMVVLLVVRVPNSGIRGTDASLLYATLLISGLVIARQAVAIRENRRTVEDQRTDLVASISHELRTPLTAVLGFLEILDAEAIEDGDERREITSIARLQASYLSQIVSDLLMLATGHSSTIELDVTATTIDGLVWASMDAAAVDPSSVRVDAQRDTTAFLDTGRTQQALANLLANAERYGGDNIMVVAKADNGALVLEVHDDGAGVPSKYELLIWEKFERGPNRLNATVPGSGIGLAVTNAIAKAHGGLAGYRRSERLGGACFWIRLPGRVHAEVARPKNEDPVNLAIVDGHRGARSA